MAVFLRFFNSLFGLFGFLLKLFFGHLLGNFVQFRQSVADMNFISLGFIFALILAHRFYPICKTSLGRNGLVEKVEVRF